MFGIRLLVETGNRKTGKGTNDELHNLYSSRKGDMFSQVTLQLTVCQSVSQYVKVSSPTQGFDTRYYFLSECCFLKVAVLSLVGGLSDERTGLQFPA
jgi:hypothetical protein